MSMALVAQIIDHIDFKQVLTAPFDILINETNKV